MPLFITYASYSHTAIKGMVSEPTDRTAAINSLVEKAGGKLVAAYMTTGSNDIVIITEVADGSDAVAAGMAAAATGAFTKLETVRAWTLPDFKGIQEKATRIGAGFKAPGT
ncbi:GYD domain-containing protein [Bradyrhizobium arachidis]|uniref:GYD domain-containing protein n=1 Tax=Bradyrhizobium arachidis TaxID=858423 RepID=UPI002162700C|nr:GYD domain-containing protein [Bradyrhizobium arachidis]UVO34521.1 GYD domain-containing protein [Bradyrhizobium arachidis]